MAQLGLKSTKGLNLDSESKVSVCMHDNKLIYS